MQAAEYAARRIKLRGQGFSATVPARRRLRFCPVFDSQVGDLPKCAVVGDQHGARVQGVGGDQRVERRERFSKQFEIGPHRFIVVRGVAVPRQYIDVAQELRHSRVAPARFAKPNSNSP